MTLVQAGAPGINTGSHVAVSEFAHLAPNSKPCPRNNLRRRVLIQPPAIFASRAAPIIQLGIPEIVKRGC